MPIASFTNENPFDRGINQGLKDCGEHVLRCSNCDAPLCKVWQISEEKDVELKVIAKCDHCGDQSFPVTIRGMFNYDKGVIPDKNRDFDKDIVYTEVIDLEWPEQSNKIYLLTKVVKKWE